MDNGDHPTSGPGSFDYLVSEFFRALRRIAATEKALASALTELDMMKARLARANRDLFEYEKEALAEERAARAARD